MYTVIKQTNYVFVLYMYDNCKQLYDQAYYFNPSIFHILLVDL